MGLPGTERSEEPLFRFLPTDPPMSQAVPVTASTSILEFPTLALK